MLLSSSAVLGNRRAVSLFSRRSSTITKGFFRRQATSAMLSVHVHIKVKPGNEEAFKQASILNAASSVQEKGVVRFDVLQDLEDPTQFKLVEVYDGADAPALHKETKHYAVWRDTVADWMAEPRSASKYTTVEPKSRAEWNVPAFLAAGGAEGEGDPSEQFFVLHPVITAKPEHAATLRDLLIADSADSLSKEPGVLRFDLAVSADDPAAFTLNEVYTDEAAFDAHCKEPHFAAVMGPLPEISAAPLAVRKYRTIFPRTRKGWKSE